MLIRVLISLSFSLLKQPTKVEIGWAELGWQSSCSWIPNYGLDLGRIRPEQSLLTLIMAPQIRPLLVAPSTLLLLRLFQLSHNRQIQTVNTERQKERQRIRKKWRCFWHVGSARACSTACDKLKLKLKLSLSISLPFENDDDRYTRPLVAVLCVSLPRHFLSEVMPLERLMLLHKSSSALDQYGGDHVQ